jgi:hypothetical protein
MRAALVVLAVAFTACSTATVGLQSTRPGEGLLLVGSNTVRYGVGETLQQVLAHNQPIMLKPRGVRNDPIGVYVNGLYSGDLEVLEMIPAHEVMSVTKLNATEAAGRFGRHWPNGAILVRLVGYVER